MGESDRLLTVLTREYGLIRAVAPGSRKHESGLRGRSGLFVVNDLLLVKGRGLDKIIQAESLESFPRLSLDLRKLTAAQYLAELTLYQALSDQPQTELFEALRLDLSQLETAQDETILPLLVSGTMQMLRLAGVTPEVNQCCVTRQPIPEPSSTDSWLAGFHPAAGGLVQLAVFDKMCHRERYGNGTDLDPTFPSVAPFVENRSGQDKNGTNEATETGAIATNPECPSDESRVRQPRGVYRSRLPVAGTRLKADELTLLRQVASAVPAMVKEGPAASLPPAYPQATWLALERALRYYAQYHFERTIQSASLVDTCFAPLPSTV